MVPRRQPPKEVKEPTGSNANKLEDLAAVVGTTSVEVELPDDECKPGSVAPFQNGEDVNAAIKDKQRIPDAVGVSDKNIPDILVDKGDAEAKKETIWKKVENMSDDETTIEVANLTGWQFKCCLLRIRIEGRLTGQIIKLDNVRYHIDKGFQTR